MLSEIKQLESDSKQVMQRDRFRIRRSLQQLKRRIQGSPNAKPEITESSDQDLAALEKLRTTIEKSIETKKTRQQKLPEINFDIELPIYERRDEIAEAIKHNQVVVVSGETGSGKSTQLPLIALQAGYGVRGLIGHTQPRRIAARGVASRIAQQLKSPLGQTVGFKIRFDDKTSNTTNIKLMTDGILLAETQSDRFLDNYDLIIIDEAHERSLNIDFLLGFIHRILRNRPDLRIVITSATIDTARFAEHFTSDANRPVPIINVEGRTYPVETRYKTPEEFAGNEDADINDAVVAGAEELSKIDSGDILIFLPTENDIRTVNRKLKTARLGGRATDILPLYARLSTEQQNLIFRPNSRRRIVLATNVAESSITVPGIRFVIDTGTARISRYAPRSKVQRLPIEAISQASANQRAGRCGRVGPGICLRLFSEEDFNNRPAFTTPEIRRTNLASVILQTLHLKLGDISTFPFIDPPHPDAIRDGFKTLFEIGAIDNHRRLNDLGRWLGRLPVDPRIGKMIWAADQEGCLAETLIIASALEIQDPRTRPAEKKQAADAQHAEFTNEKSDFMSYLKLWDFIHKLKSDLSRSKFKRACQQKFLSLAHIHQWLEVHRQLKSMVQQNGLKPTARKDDYNSIHRSLLSGLLSGTAMLADRHEYTGAGGIKFHIWPGSGVFGEKPKWIVTGEIVETSRRYGRTLGKIAPEWIESIADHLVKRSHNDPHWSKKRQTVMAYENVSLFGLPIVLRRPVNFSRIEPEIARDLFIEKGLVGDELTAEFDFYTHNQCLLDDLKQLASKTRRRDWIIDDGIIIDFYHQRLPDQAVDTAALKKLLKDNPELSSTLEMTRSDIVPGTDAESAESQFPSRVQVGSMQLPVNYAFQPGQTDDGATVRIPVEGMGQLDDAQAGWLIPGQAESRIVSLIKSLPKQIRRNFVPAPVTAKKVAASLKRGAGSFDVAVAQELTRLCGQPITAELFDNTKTDPHLKVNIQVVDESGDVVAQGRSVAELREQLGTEFSTNVVQVDDEQWSQSGLRDWTWGDMPKEIEITRGTTQLAAFPSIMDDGDSVGLRLVDSLAAAELESQLGLVRLFKIKNKKSIRGQVNWLPNFDQHAVKLSRMINHKDLKRQLGDLIVRIALVERKKCPRTESEFNERQNNAVEMISIATQEIAKWLPKLADAAHKMHLALEKMPEKFSSAKGNIRSQLKYLTLDDFLGRTPWRWLMNYPRYFNAIESRISKLPSTATAKDRSDSDEVAKFWEKFELLSEQHIHQSIVDPELQMFRWMIEEYRVSLFAQQLGTSMTVSAKRLEKQWNKVRRI